jgi:hypothetical protein
MHPDKRALRRLGRRGLGEGPVHLAEIGPVHGVVIVAFLEAVQDRPERLFRGDVVELAHLMGRERQARDGVFAVGVVDLDHLLELRVRRVFGQFPRHPGAVIDRAEEALERRHDAVRAGVFLQHDAAVFLNLFVGLAVVDDDEIR